MTWISEFPSDRRRSETFWSCEPCRTESVKLNRTDRTRSMLSQSCQNCVVKFRSVRTVVTDHTVLPKKGFSGLTSLNENMDNYPTKNYYHNINNSMTDDHSGEPEKRYWCLWIGEIISDQHLSCSVHAGQVIVEIVSIVNIP